MSDTKHKEIHVDILWEQGHTSLLVLNVLPEIDVKKQMDEVQDMFANAITKKESVLLKMAGGGSALYAGAKICATYVRTPP